MVGPAMARVNRLGFWFLLTFFSAGVLWGGTFPTDSHPPTLEAAHELLQAICAADNVVPHGTHGVSAGCRSCPDIVPGNEDFNSVRSNTPVFLLESVIYGSFTRAGVREAVASFSGCEPHSHNFGGSILLEKAPSGWQVESYHPAFISDQCFKYPLKSGRDILLCEGETGGQGEMDTWLFTYDYARPERHQAKTLVSTIDTVSHCLPGDQFVGSIERVQLRDLNHDGMPDLMVSVKAGKVHIPSGHESNCPGNLSLPPVKTYELDFLFSDETFEIAPWNARTKQAVEAVFAQY
jgi:hypothetical protein